MLNDQPLLHLHTELTSDEVTELERFVTALDDSNLPDGVEWKPKIEALRKALTNLAGDSKPVPEGAKKWALVKFHHAAGVGRDNKRDSKAKRIADKHARSFFKRPFLVKKGVIYFEDRMPIFRYREKVYP